MKHFQLSLLIFFAIFFSNTSFSQNNSVEIYYDSILPIVEQNYSNGKKAFENFCLTNKVDPSSKLDFLSNSLYNDDLIYFKEQIQDVILNYGYKFTRKDTLAYIENDFCRLVVSKGLGTWLIHKSDSLYPLWIQKNPQGYEVMLKIHELRTIDKTHRDFRCKKDSCNSFSDLIKKVDTDNFKKLLKICKQNNNTVPNQFDNSFDCGWSIILAHNFSHSNMFDVWNMILPYIEKAYFEHKIGDGSFEMFDKLLYQFNGTQYYGFLENVPVVDEENVSIRRKKYGFN